MFSLLWLPSSCYVFSEGGRSLLSLTTAIRSNVHFIPYDTAVLPVRFREIVLQPNLRSPESVAFPNSRFEDIDGLEVHYLREEDPSAAGPRCVLHMNHGFGASSSSWSPVIRALSSELGALAIAHDTPGFGLTARVGLLKANRYSLRNNAGEEVPKES